MGRREKMKGKWGENGYKMQRIRVKKGLLGNFSCKLYFKYSMIIFS